MDSRANKEKEKVIGKINFSTDLVLIDKRTLSYILRCQEKHRKVIKKIIGIMENANKVNRAMLNTMREVGKIGIEATERIEAIEDRLGIAEKEVGSIKKLKASWKPYINLLKEAIANQEKYLEEHK